MTQLHHITLFFLFLFLSLPISLATTLPLTFGPSPDPPVPPPYSTPEPIPPKSTPIQPLTPPSIDPIDNSTNTSNAPYDCFKTSPFLPPARPLYNDCQSAIRRLPVEFLPGHFHTGDPDDGHRLPRVEEVETCRLVIGLDPTARHGDYAPWRGVGRAAFGLNDACVQYGRLKEFFGGKTRTGGDGLITIALLYSGMVGLGDNETEVASS